MVKNKALSESAYISELAMYMAYRKKKGNDIIRLGTLRNIFSSVTDYFVILSCRVGHRR